MDAIIIFAGLAAVLYWASRKNSLVSGMNDNPVSLENVRRGVKNGWYTATLLRVDGKPAIRLSGKVTNGRQYSDTYPISEADYATLRSEGLPEE